MTLTLTSKSDSALLDKHFTVKCPHCMALSGLSAISLPQFPLLKRYQPNSVGIAYQCDACHETVFLRFPVKYEFQSARIFIDDDDFTEIERPQENCEFNYLPKEISQDFREALTCYANSCFNAFAAMCRRTIQSASTELGSDGKDKVLRQIEDLKSMSVIDEETFVVLKTIVIAGHDGAHPHLPILSAQRAEILLELMKDVLYQLFVRKQKIVEAARKRQEAIESSRQK